MNQAYSWEWTMRAGLALAAVLSLYGALASPTESAPGKEAIQRMLLEQREWMLIYQIGPAMEPSATATKFPKAFYLREGRLMGEWAGRPAGYECPYEVPLRDDGFGFKICGYDQPFSFLEYDPGDARYPFKRVNTPTKWWLEKRNQ